MAQGGSRVVQRELWVLCKTISNVSVTVKVSIHWETGNCIRWQGKYFIHNAIYVRKYYCDQPWLLCSYIIISVKHWQVMCKTCLWQRHDVELEEKIFRHVTVHIGKMVGVQPPVLLFLSKRNIGKQNRVRNVHKIAAIVSFWCCEEIIHQR